MKQKWGREGYAGEWPSSKPVWTIAAFFVALASVAAISVYRYERVWTPLQRFYLTQYLASGTNPIRKSSRYLLLNAVDKKGSRLALDEEVVPTMADESTFALTEEAVKAGDQRLEWQRGQYDDAKIHAYLGHWIYGDQTFLDLAKPALWGGLWVFAFGLIVAIPKDRARRRERKEGRRLKGPELVTVAEFNLLRKNPYWARAAVVKRSAKMRATVPTRARKLWDIALTSPLTRSSPSEWLVSRAANHTYTVVRYYTPATERFVRRYSHQLITPCDTDSSLFSSSKSHARFCPTSCNNAAIDVWKPPISSESPLSKNKK